ncbi:hypothetical protein SNEBB_005529 [Seison nebaliae]|nr:hypothetical protein SNEBB_005529 [Seison nebaliae]
MNSLKQRNTTKYTEAQWEKDNESLKNDSEKTRFTSFGVRQEGKSLQNETAIAQWWGTHDNNVKLSDRLQDIDEWRGILRATEKDVDYEMKMLLSTKELAENYCNDLKIPMDVTAELYASRDGRQGIDNVYDGPERELEKENKLLLDVKKQLHERCLAAFDQLCRLKQSRQQLVRDQEDKLEAYSIDENCLMLTKNSANIGFKPDAYRTPKNSVSLQEWVDFSKHNKAVGDAEVLSSKELREKIHHDLSKAQALIVGQQNATEYAIRKRIHETEKALKELQWQRQQDENELRRLEDDINKLETSMFEKDPSIKLAQTRLENRHLRPHIELVSDDVHYGLLNEGKNLEAMRAALQTKMDEAKYAWNNLLEQRERVNNEIQNKENTLIICNRALAARNRLVYQKYPTTETEKNMILTGLDERELKAQV